MPFLAKIEKVILYKSIHAFKFLSVNDLVLSRSMLRIAIAMHCPFLNDFDQLLHDSLLHDRSLQ